MAQTADELRREIEERRSAVGRDLDALGYKVSPGQIVQRRTQAVREGVSGVRERVMGTAEDAAGGARGVAGSAKDALSSTPDVARRQVQGSPLAAGVIAFGAGVLAAAVLPPTRREQQLAQAAQPALTTAATEVRGAGQEAVSQLQEPARDAAQQVATTAQEAAGHVAERGREAATNVADEARSAREQGGSSGPGQLGQTTSYQEPGTQPGRPGAF